MNPFCFPCNQEEQNLDPWWEILTGRGTQVNNLAAAASTPMTEDPDKATEMFETVYTALEEVRFKIAPFPR